MLPPPKPKLSTRTDEYLRLYTTDELRRRYQTAPGGDDPPTELRDGVMISREEIKAVILWRVWWERFGNYLLLIGAVAAVIAAVEGTMPTGTSSGVQSPSGGSAIPVLALVVAALAVFFGPLVARANTQRQIRASARETWMREFRQHAAEILRNHGLHPSEADEARDIFLARRLSYHAMRLLIAERAPLYDAFVPHLEAMWKSSDREAELNFPKEFTTAAADILQRERTAIVEDPGVWREVWNSLGLDAVAWRSWPWRPTQGGPS